MAHERKLPTDPIAFIQDCVRRRQIFWTYHINMRLKGRSIHRDAILAVVDIYDLVEAYPADKYLPSYLVLARWDSDCFHLLCAADVEGNNVRMITAYRPDPEEWEENLTKRRAES